MNLRRAAIVLTGIGFIPALSVAAPAPEAAAVRICTAEGVRLAPFPAGFPGPKNDEQTLACHSPFVGAQRRGAELSSGRRLHSLPEGKTL